MQEEMRERGFHPPPAPPPLPLAFFTPLQFRGPFYILLPHKDQVSTGELIHEWYAFCVKTCWQYCPLQSLYVCKCKLLFTIVMQVSLFLFIEASNLKKAVTLEKQWFGVGDSKYAFSFVFCCSSSLWYYLQDIFFSLESLSDHCSTQRLTSMVGKVLADFYIIPKRARTSQQLC